MVNPQTTVTRDVGLSKFVADIVGRIDGCAHASVSIHDAGHLQVIASTDPAIDAALGADGPARAAIQNGCVARVHSTRTCRDYDAEFLRACDSLDIRSLAAFPIRDEDRAPIGVLTLTSHDHFGFGTRELKTARDAVNAATPLVAHAVSAAD